MELKLLQELPKNVSISFITEKKLGKTLIVPLTHGEVNMKHKKSTTEQAFERLRKPTAPPSSTHKDEKMYNRKNKHKKKIDIE